MIYPQSEDPISIGSLELEPQSKKDITFNPKYIHCSMQYKQALQKFSEAAEDMYYDSYLNYKTQSSLPDGCFSLWWIQISHTIILSSAHTMQLSQFYLV